MSDIVPASMAMATAARISGSSYAISCAAARSAPIRENLLAEAHPAISTPITPTAEMASTKNNPTSSLAATMSTPNAGPNGRTTRVTITGTTTTAGARENTHRSAALGTMSSFWMNFTPSAISWAHAVLHVGEDLMLGVADDHRGGEEKPQDQPDLDEQDDPGVLHQGLEEVEDGGDHPALTPLPLPRPSPPRATAWPSGSSGRSPSEGGGPRTAPAAGASPAADVPRSRCRTAPRSPARASWLRGTGRGGRGRGAPRRRRSPSPGRGDVARSSRAARPPRGPPPCDPRRRRSPRNRIPGPGRPGASAPARGTGPAPPSPRPRRGPPPRPGGPRRTAPGGAGRPQREAGAPVSLPLHFSRMSSPAIFSWSLMIPCSSASGRGGQPGT